MNYTENYRGIKIDVQSPHIDISEVIQVEIRASIDKLARFTKDINAVDIYFKSEAQNGSSNHTVGIRWGIPGPDMFAEERGDNWVTSLKAVVNNLIRQLEKK